MSAAGARTLSGLNSTWNDGATAWIAASWPIETGLVGSRRIAARATLGAICFSSPSHLPLMPYSTVIKPVTLPPGRAKLATKPAPTGSTTFANTIGTVRVVCCMGYAAAPLARSAAGAMATNSSAYLR